MTASPRATPPSLTFNAGIFNVGPHTVEATVSDPTTFVRSDPEQLLTERVTWSVNVTAAANPIDGSEFFVTQHYRDFLLREPDAVGPPVLGAGHRVVRVELGMPRGQAHRHQRRLLPLD